AALAEEVERWLGDEPVLAHREPVAARLRRWGRRHRTLVAAGMALLAAGVLGLVLGLWAVALEQGRTARALDWAVLAEEKARANLAQAEANLYRAVKAEGIAKDNLKQARDNLTRAVKAEE